MPSFFEGSHSFSVPQCCHHNLHIQHTDTSAQQIVIRVFFADELHLEVMCRSYWSSPSMFREGHTVGLIVHMLLSDNKAGIKSQIERWESGTFSLWAAKKISEESNKCYWSLLFECLCVKEISKDNCLRVESKGRCVHLQHHNVPSWICMEERRSQLRWNCRFTLRLAESHCRIVPSQLQEYVCWLGKTVWVKLSFEKTD